MAVDTTLKEICELLTSATRSGLLHWKSDVVDEVINARLDKTWFTINADSPTPTNLYWLITLSVFKHDGQDLKQVFSVTLNSDDPDQKDDAEMLVDVWKLASARKTGGAAERLEPVMESLRTAIKAAGAH
jgi:hypothetical protein